MRPAVSAAPKESEGDEMTETKHYPVGGSTIERIMLCPGSRAACEKLPPMPAGKAAERGTRIHTRVEDIFYGRKSKEKPSVDEDRVAQAMYAKLIEVATSLGFAKEELKVEEQIAFLSIHPTDAGGTPDVVASRAFGDLLVVDFKTGVNFVGANENIQLLFYAAAHYFEKLDELTRMTLGNVHVVILQPDMNDHSVIHSRIWTAPASRLAGDKERFHAAVANSILRDWERIPGNHCEDKYCDARSVCVEYKAWLNKSTDDQLFDLVDKANKGQKLEPTANGIALAPLLKAKAKVVKFFEAAEKLAIAELTANAEAVPGYMLEPGQGQSRWADEKAVETAAKKAGLKIDDYKPRSFCTITKFKELTKGKLTEDEVKALTVRPETDSKLKEKPTSNIANFAPPAPPAVQPDFSSLL